MSILIKGMEMPKSCFDCPFMYQRRYCRCNTQIEFNDPDYSELRGRYEGCPLSTVPPPIIPAKDYPTPQTNGDRIRAMTDEELAKWISKHDCHTNLYGYDPKDAILDWLKTEATQKDGEREDD